MGEVSQCLGGMLQFSQMRPPVSEVFNAPQGS